MKRKAILVIAIMMIMPGANAAGIRSAAGISQNAWNASPEYQNFQCPAGTNRGEGIDLNFTTDRSDDYYFVECNAIVAPTPTPVQPTPVIPVVDTQTATTAPVQNTSNSVQNFVQTETSTAHVDTRTVTIVETSTAHVDYLALDWSKVDMTTFDWNDFWNWLTAYIEDLLAVKL